MAIPGGTLTLSSGNLSPLVQTAFDTVTGKYLYEKPTFRSLADKKPVHQAMPGSVVTLTITGKLPLATTPLTENLDVNASPMPAPRQLNVTIQEYGNPVVTTKRLSKTEFTQALAMEVGEEVGRNANDSIDLVYQTVLDSASNTAYVHATNGFTLTDPTTNLGTITSKSAATAVTGLRRRLAEPRFGDMHFVVAHPDTLHDLMQESGTNTWQTPHQYEDTQSLYTMHVGDYMGARWFSHTACTVVAGTPDYYTSYFVGREALVELVADEVHTEIGPQIDALNRFHTIGWVAMLGVSRYRENAIQLLKTKSSIEAINFPAFDPKA